jgi:hypothetical protein
MFDPKPDDLTIIGRVNFRSDRRLFGIKRADRRQHMHLLGQTGTGKSTTLLAMIVQDIARGEGVGVIDPHGDLAERVLGLVPPRRINDVIYFDPSDIEYPIGLNILDIVQLGHADFQTQRVLVSSGVVSVLKKLWADSWGPRLEHFLRSAVLALLDVPGSTLLGVSRIFSDEDFRERIVARCRDPVVRDFWLREFPSYNSQFRAEAVSPILNKVGQFLSTGVIRNIVGQSRSGFDISAAMNSGKILVANLAKGKIGEDNSSLLGALLVTRFQLAAMARAKIAEEARRDFYLYVDEFQNFTTQAFGTILSEARKYRLSMILAHQFVAQLPQEVANSIFGNVGSVLGFRLGADDATILEQEFQPTFTKDDLLRIENHAACIRLMVDGTPVSPFSMVTVRSVASARPVSTHTAKIIPISRERYARARAAVEEAIAAFMRSSQEQEQS